MSIGSYFKRIVGTLVVLTIVGGTIWFVFKPAKGKTQTTTTTRVVENTETVKVEKTAPAKTTTVTTPTAEESYLSNKESWSHKELETAAQMSLVGQQDRLIRDLVEQEFVKYDPVAVAIAGNMIHRIGGEGAIRVVLEYKDDQRVVVRKNVEWWYGQYNPGALDDRIERLEVEHNITAAKAPPTGEVEEAVENCVVEKPNPLGMFRKARAPKNGGTTNAYDEEQQQIKDQIEHSQYKIRQNESVLRNTQHLLSTSTSKDPRVKAHRRERVRELQENIQKEREKISKLETQLQK